MRKLRPLIVTVVAVAVLAYLGGIVWAGIASLMKEPGSALPEIVTQAITAIGGLLATNFGAMFGISLLTGGNRQRATRILLWALPPNPTDETQPLGRLQVAAAWLYFVSLLGAAVLWACTGFSSSSAPVLVNMTSTLIGVLAGVGAVALNVRRQ